MSRGSFGSPDIRHWRSPQSSTASYAPTANPMGTQAELLPRVVGKPMTKSSCITRVPLLPINSSTTPFQPSSPASVTTKDGIPIFVMIKPCSRPIRARAERRGDRHGRRRLRAVGHQQHRRDHAGDAADVADREVDLAEQQDEDEAHRDDREPAPCTMRFTKLPAVRKRPFSTWKTTR